MFDLVWEAPSSLAWPVHWHSQFTMGPRDTASDDDDRDEEQKASPAVATDERRRLQLQQASQRSRKRQKHESILCATQFSAVRQEIATLQRTLDTAAQASPDGAAAYKSAVETIALEQRIAFLRDKLEAHRSWIVKVHNILASAPLLDFALRMQAQDVREEKDQEHEAPGQHHDFAAVDAWREAPSESTFSPLLIAQHIDAFVVQSQDNAAKLLTEFDDPRCDFGVTFTSRGWAHAAHVDDKLLTFRSRRVLSNGVVTQTIATAVWQSIQLDDILRTFVPVVQDSIAVYESETRDRVVASHVVYLETSGAPHAIATVESMQAFGLDGVSGYQIAVESCDDPCLLAHAVERLAHSSGAAPNATPSLKQRPDVVLAARCYPHASGVVVLLAGSIRHDNAWPVHSSSAVDLVQFFVSMLPIYEELHLLAQ